jgi:Ca-activated chloride channel homolog
MRLPEKNRFPIQFLTLCLVLSGLYGFHWWDPVAKWMERGNNSLETGDSETARNAYQKAAEKAPGDERIHHNKALAAFSEEEYEEAVDLFDLASKSRDPETRGRSLYNRGCAYMQKGDLEKAAESFVESLKLNPNDEDAKVNLEMILNMLARMPTPTPEPSEGSDDSSNPESDTTPTPDAEQTPETDADQTPETDADQTPDPEQERNDTGGTATPEPEYQSQTDPDIEPTPTVTGSPAGENSSGQESPTPQQPPADGIMSQSEAERLLDALEEDEMSILKRLHQLPSPEDQNIEKDW